MTSLDSRALEGLDYIKKDAGDYFVEIESYTVSKLDGESMQNTEDCGYINKEDIPKLKDYVENNCGILKGNSLAKVNVYTVIDDCWEAVEVIYPRYNSMNKEKWGEVIEEIKGKTYNLYEWADEVNEKCITTKRIYFGDFRKKPFSSTEFIGVYEEDYDTYIVLEVLRKIEEESIEIIDGWIN